jgi:hypothetical protein
VTVIINFIMGLVLRWLPAIRSAAASPRVIMAGLAAALALTITIEQTRLASARRHAVVAALSLSNLAALHDSTRDAAANNERIARLLGDSLRLAEIRVMQVAQHADALDKALGRERVARYVDHVTVDSLRRFVRGTNASKQASDSNAGARVDQTVRSAFFNIRHEPYTVAAQVEIPAPPDSSRIELHVAIDPIPIEARVSCSSPDGQGIKTATVSASSPTWATVRFGRVEQSPDVCGSPALRAGGHSRHSFVTKQLLVGLGRALTPNGWRWAMFAGAGVGLGL